jgi:putative tricarboxylic transport membrane protein
VAPPGLSDADESRLLDLVARLHSSGIWREAIARHRWTDTYLAGPAFGRVIRAEDARLARILAELGL